MRCKKPYLTNNTQWSCKCWIDYYCNPIIRAWNRMCCWFYWWQKDNKYLCARSIQKSGLVHLHISECICYDYTRAWLHTPHSAARVAIKFTRLKSPIDLINFETQHKFQEGTQHILLGINANNGEKKTVKIR